MRKLILLCLLVLSATTIYAETVKTVAVMPTIDRGNALQSKSYLREAIRMDMEEAVGNTAGFVTYDRSAFDAIASERKFQSSGEVKDSEIKAIGEMAGVDYVLVCEVAGGDGYIKISAKVMDMVSGQYERVHTSSFVEMNPQAIEKEVQQLCDKMFGGITSSSSSSSPSSSSPARPGSHQNFTETAWGINMQMVWVEGGDFLMGCTSEQSDCDTDEQNVRRVTLDGYYICQFEVTISQWEKVIGTSIYQQRNKAKPDGAFRGTGADYSMYYVSWEEAMEFCRVLSQKTGRTYTLPTEAQWEYAARGGNKADGTKYAGSNMVDVVAWYKGNSGDTNHPVGTKRPNALGLYDMSGNVWEWCRDWYSSDYRSYETNNPTGPSSGSSRVCRGGGWSSNGACRVSYRGGNTPSFRNYDLGFRVVCLP